MSFEDRRTQNNNPAARRAIGAGVNHGEPSKRPFSLVGTMRKQLGLEANEDGEQSKGGNDESMLVTAMRKKFPRE